MYLAGGQHGGPPPSGSRPQMLQLPPTAFCTTSLSTCSLKTAQDACLLGEPSLMAQLLHLPTAGWWLALSLIGLYTLSLQPLHGKLEVAECLVLQICTNESQKGAQWGWWEGRASWWAQLRPAAGWMRSPRRRGRVATCSKGSVSRHWGDLRGAQPATLSASLLGFILWRLGPGAAIFYLAHITLQALPCMLQEGQLRL